MHLSPSVPPKCVSIVHRLIRGPRIIILWFRQTVHRSQRANLTSKSLLTGCSKVHHLMAAGTLLDLHRNNLLLWVYQA
ncbi:hypothetical protein Hanom_Chr09g00842211 [Helianthus anomalus]